MARKAVKETRLGSWEEVDQALRRIAEINREESKAENALNRRIDELKESHAAKIKPAQEERKALEKDIKSFAEARKAEDFAQGSRTRKLVFGSVNFRHVTKIVVHNTQNTIAAIYKIFGQSKAEDFLNIKTTVDKESLAGLKDDELATIGCTRNTEDTFGYEVAKEELVG